MDSFDLDLTTLGLNVFLGTRWFGCEGQLVRNAQSPSDEVWWGVRRAEDLARWERAWGPKYHRAAPVFLPTLLAAGHTIFLAASRERQIVGGAVLYAHAGVVGISNVFSPEPRHEDYVRTCTAIGRVRFPGLPVVVQSQLLDISFGFQQGFDYLGPASTWDNL